MNNRVLKTQIETAPFYRAFLALLCVTLVACGPTGRKSLTEDSATNDATPTPSPETPTAPPYTRGATAVSGGGLGQRSAAGAKANLTYGTTTTKIQSATPGGYKVYLSISGELASDGSVKR